MEDAAHAEPGTSQAEVCLKSMQTSTFNRLKILFITCHGLALNARPFTDIRFQSEMDKQKGLDVGQTYLNSKAARQFTHYISETVREAIAQDVRSAPFLAIIIDGATDSARVEQELIYVHYCKQGVIKTKFLAIESVEKADAVVSGFQKSADIDEPTLYNKLVAFASDGATVMTGHKSGLVTRLRDHQPHLVGIHCVNHKLELSYKDIFKNQQTFKDIEQLLLDLYLFYEHSPLNRSNLQKAADAAGIGEHAVIPLRVGGTRWVTYTYRALERLFKAYTAVTLHLSQVSVHITIHKLMQC